MTAPIEARPGDTAITDVLVVPMSTKPVAREAASRVPLTRTPHSDGAATAGAIVELAAERCVWGVSHASIALMSGRVSPWQ